MEIPFIKLFRTVNARYFYEVGTDEILRVDEETYAYLESILSGEIVTPEGTAASKVETLKSFGYLSSQKPSGIKHPFSDIMPLMLERKLDTITLQVTQDCNFRCKYCIYSEDKNLKQRMHSPKHMTWETAKKAIDFYYAHSVDSEKGNIGFYGGEPLLRFELIKRVVEYAEAKFSGRKTSFSMTTNGSLLTDEIMDYLADHSITLMVSLDGPKEIHDKNRVFVNGNGTFDAVIERLTKLHERYPDYFRSVRINIVLSPDNDLDVVNALTRDLPYADILQIGTNSLDSEETIVYPREFIVKSEYHKFLGYTSSWGYISSDKLSPLANDRKRDLSEIESRFSASIGGADLVSPSGPCMPGKSRLFVNADERLYPCERVNENEVMCIGSLDNGFDGQAAASILNIATLTSERCRSCWAQRHCILCAKYADSGNKLSAESRLSNCKYSLAKADNDIRLMILSKEIPAYYPDSIIDW